MARTSVEHFARVYDDDHGFFVEVSEDKDSLGLCRISYEEHDARPREIVISWDMAHKLADAIKLIERLNKSEAA